MRVFDITKYILIGVRVNANQRRFTELRFESFNELR